MINWAVTNNANQISGQGIFNYDIASILTLGEFYNFVSSEYYIITDDDYFKFTQPTKSDVVANRVVVNVFPLTISEIMEITTSEEITLAPTETKSLLLNFTTPVKNGAVSLIIDPGLIEVTSNIFSSHRVNVVLHNYGSVIATCKIGVTGRKLEALNNFSVTASDTDSINKYGVQQYTLPDNELIQDETTARTIANTILSNYKILRKDCDIDWRGNPAIELQDITNIVTYNRHGHTVTDNFKIIKNSIVYDGGMRATLIGRKI